MEYNYNMDADLINKLNESSSGDMGNFVQSYRQSLEDQYNADVNALNNQRNLDYTTIMSGANTKGMLHSTFPTRDKLKYDTTTYEPNLVKTRQSYQTGLDSLYSNVANYYNQIKNYKESISDIQDKINDLNET